jgi:hypothetical protein
MRIRITERQVLQECVYLVCVVWVYHQQVITHEQIIKRYHDLAARDLCTPDDIEDKAEWAYGKCCTVKSAECSVPGLHM